MRILFTECKEGDEALFRAALDSLEVITTNGTLAEADEDAAIGILSVMAHSHIGTDGMDALPSLRFIATRSTGVDHIDLESARDRGIVVSNVPSYGGRTVAEHTMLLILAVAKNLPAALKCAGTGKFDLSGLVGVDFAGKTLGIVGVGQIGECLATMANGFDMEVVGYDPEPRDVLDLTYVELADLYRRSDFLALCCPLNDATRHMIGRSAIAQLKPGVFVINTGRGAVIDSVALYEALEAGNVGGAGLDVLEMEHLLRPGAREPVGEKEAAIVALNKSLMLHQRVVVTPHMAFYTAEALERIREVTVENITRFLSGSPTNVVHN